ncbi:Phytanoyl-CoA dioxygenase (PhyH) [Roseovarius litorisediminis]|uniref:Phytanoyl-CoA dioxygenase (PhyH) n=1 Tax=Roseovarius litorisediminis TaxID=1312363 RepID=A0A1Y5T622_9RHOB|nr:phytanoyl-CoA dioxygenase family protein [Roseovarius litorisediminis]SLN56650.1 Phytanoyl-CoA dioxygenase (PhyH) [Roseovarius litorisediminis]
MIAAAFSDEFRETGRVWSRDALDDKTLQQLDLAADHGTRPGARLTTGQSTRILATDGPVTQMIRRFYPLAFPVRLVAFNKSDAGNWSVPWHQDRVIAVQERHDLPGFSNWSNKAGLWHCEPPAAILADMLFVRVHLDDAGAQDGAMEIALGSHRLGVVRASDASSAATTCKTEMCSARRGDILIMNMLLLHRSKPSQTANRRRVLRIDYAVKNLPQPLQWVAV